MPKGRPWTTEQEARLKQLAESGTPLKVIAAKLSKSQGAVLIKAERLGLKVVKKHSKVTTTSVQLPKDLPSVEEALKILAGALNAASKPGLDRVEVQRLQVVATLARTYKNLLADYIGYRQIETKLVELESKYARIAEKTKGEKAKGNASK